MKRHGGSGLPQGQLNRGPRVLPSGGAQHGGTHASRTTKPVLSPALRQARMATSWHGAVRQTRSAPPRKVTPAATLAPKVAGGRFASAGCPRRFLE